MKGKLIEWDAKTKRLWIWYWSDFIFSEAVLIDSLGGRARRGKGEYPYSA